MADVEKAKAEGKVGIFFGAQNCSPIDDEIGLIEVMRRQGLLIMQLTYNNQSLLATGCYEQNDSGVTRFGKQAIEEMNRVGMIIDMSHSAERSTLELSSSLRVQFVSAMLTRRLRMTHCATSPTP